MGRIGRKPIPVPDNVKIIFEESQLAVEGPAGKLSLAINPGVSIKNDVNDKVINVIAKSNSKTHSALQGLFRSLINNMIIGVVSPFEKKLEISGVGYGAKMDGGKIVLQVGYSHPIVFDIPEALKVDLPDAQHIHVKGADKQKVGEFAAILRSVKVPDPYKVKGIKYFDEIIQRKSGKAFVGG